MTTPPKAKKFRIRRVPPPPAPEPVVPQDEDGFGPEPFPTSERDVLQDEGPAPAADELAAIRAEGLTGRQLRLARRVAQKHGIVTDSDYDAVRILRKQGIDPFQRANILALVSPEPEDEAEDEAPIKLPQTVRQGGNLPAPQVMDEAQRARAIMKVQRDIVRRRRRRFAMLMVRLAMFVMLPTVVAGWYYYRVATPFFATHSEFVIQQAEPAGASGLSSLFRGTQLGTSQDAITVQSYLQSRDAMLRLDADLGFKTHFSDPAIDPVQRLATDASNEAAYRIYKRNVKIGYDPTEGIIKMEVIAANPLVSQRFSEALIGYAEEQVDNLTFRLREDQMKGARESYADAEDKVRAAQARVLELQEQLGIIDPVTETSAVMSQVATFETQLQQKRLELQQLLDNAQPNQARLAGVEGDIARLEALIADLRAQLTISANGSQSLASVSGQLRIAEADLETRQLMLAQSLQQMETARIQANRQVRYLEMGVSPVAPDEPSYPRAFENTILAFLLCSGFYLMLSLTASILREQVSS